MRSPLAIRRAQKAMQRATPSPTYVPNSAVYIVSNDRKQVQKLNGGQLADPQSVAHGFACGVAYALAWARFSSMESPVEHMERMYVRKGKKR